MNAKSANDNGRSSKVFAEIFDELIEPFPQKRAEIEFVPTCIDKTNPKERDDLFASTIRSEMKHLESFIVRRFKNPTYIIADFKDADFGICILLHFLIFAFITNLKCRAISYHPKVRYAARDHALRHFNLSDKTTNSYNIIQYGYNV